jgi:serine/threonine protein kinase
MAVTSITCPFCSTLIDLQDQESVGKCPSCHQKLHGPVKGTRETPAFSLEPPGAKPYPKEKESMSTSSKNEDLRFLGPYRIVRNIGKGGMGFVYEAFDTRLNRTVALKTMEKSEGYHENVIQRFQQEARSAARLRHPHIVSVHDVGKDRGFDYFTMDLVEGVTLDRWAQGGSSLKSRVQVIEKVARALHYAHEQGVIHRDVKPGNIMMDSSGEPQIMDFGLARNTRDTKNLTIAGTILGTPAFMAPEQAMGTSSEIGPATDVWGLGIVLYEILTQKHPFETGNVYQTIYSVLHNEPDRPSKLNSEISRDLETILLKCLEKSTAKRYRSAELLADDLKAYLENRPIAARHTRWWEKILKQLDRSRAISMDEFVLEQQARQRAEAQRLELQTKVESESRKEWRLVFEDKFLGPNLDAHWEKCGGSHEILNGELRLWGGEPQILYLKIPIIGDIRIEFECRIEGPYIGDISCFLASMPLSNRKKACDSGYMFQYGAAGNSKSFIERPGCRLWERSESPIIGGTKYRVRVERVGSKLTWHVNDILIAEVEDSDPLTGPQRTSLGIYGWVSDAYYSNFKVHQLTVPMKEDILEIGQRQLGRGKESLAIQLFEEVLESSKDPVRCEQAAQGIKSAKHQLELKTNYARYNEQIRAGIPHAQLEIEGELVLKLSSGDASDLSCLKGLPLSIIVARNNHIANLEPLSEMTSLRRLDLQANKISNLDPIKKLNLETLTVGLNQLQKLCRFENANLTTLDCSNNLLKDIDPLEGGKLHWARFEVNNIESLDPLKGMPIKELLIDHNRIRDLTPLKNMVMSNLRCCGNQIESLEPIRDLPLNTLYCHHNPLRTLEPLLRKPPQTFFFDCDTIPDSELERAMSVWKTMNLVDHVRQVETLLKIRQKDIVGLKKLATRFQNHLYLFVPKFLDWDAAFNLAAECEAFLLTFESYQERRFIGTLKRSSLQVWIGLVMKDGKREWVTGESYDATKLKISDEQIKFLILESEKGKRFVGVTSRGNIAFSRGNGPGRLASIFKWKVN